MKVQVFGDEFVMMPEKALFWPSKKVLFVADLHLGKINHFRRSGIPVPARANERNWELMTTLIQATKPKRVVFLGDLFHSHYNEEWEILRQMIFNFPAAQFELVVGNHDILSEVQYERSKIMLHREMLLDPPFVFTHHPMNEVEEGVYNVAGHIHPGVLLRGNGKQAVTLPCFHFARQQALLPAFGSFTGLARIRPKKEDKVFVIVDEVVVEVRG